MTTYRVGAGETTSGLVLSSFSDSETVLSGGTAIATVVSNGGVEEIESGGIASGTVVNSQGFEYVDIGGVSFDTVVNNGGYVFLGGVTIAGGNVSGGTTSRTVLNSGGDETVFSGGTAVDTVVSGGRLEVDDPGSRSLNTVVRGGIEDLIDGTASGTVVSSGGMQIVTSGSTAINTIVSSGGQETIYQGGITSGSITLVGPATLEIDGGSSLTTPVSGFVAGDTIDLALLPYTSSGTAVLGTGNVLTVTEGGQSFALQLDPRQSFSGKTFVLSPDKYSPNGTDVTVTSATITQPTGMNPTLFNDVEQIAGQAHLGTAAEQALVVEANNISKVLAEFPGLMRFVPPRLLEAGITGLLKGTTGLTTSQSDTLAKDILANPYVGSVPRVAQPSQSAILGAFTSTTGEVNFLTNLIHQT